MSESMGELDIVNSVKKKLMESLEDKFDEYLQVVKKWFRMIADRQQLEVELSGLLSPHQKQLHKQLLILILQKSSHTPNTLAETVRPPGYYRNIDRIREGFEPLDPTLYEVTERREVDAEIPPFMINERVLSDPTTTLARLTYGAWELGLEGSQLKTAELLCIATQHFLKNVLTAVLTRKKGYKSNSNGFIHHIGTATPNPWLHNVAKKKANYFHPLEFDDLIVKPAERPPKEEYEHDAIFRLSATSCYEEAGPISLYDLILTLQMYPGLISSNFVRVINIERLYARVCHPVIDN